MDGAIRIRRSLISRPTNRIGTVVSGSMSVEGTQMAMGRRSGVGEGGEGIDG